ncbi:hypothetical protein [Chlamydiifrater phoenicopteri]|uniref:hypothetical protein n=1 Tax=Chlamydiifrater phoenicopteri TaxID=2681469 RepID=UPI001BCA81B1|nr:hypothetical protein [Chlamydiifrater phoenicopteri]
MQENRTTQRRKDLFSLQGLFLILCVSAVLLTSILFRREYRYSKKINSDYDTFFSSVLQCSRLKPSHVSAPLQKAEKIFCQRSNQLFSYSHFFASTSFLIGDSQKGALYNNMAHNKASMLLQLPTVTALQSNIIFSQSQGNFLEALQQTKQLLQELSKNKDSYPHFYFCTLLRAAYLSNKAGVDARGFKQEITKHPLYGSYCSFLDQKSWKFASYIENL